MSSGDDSPRYTHMMDFSPMDEDTPLRYWQSANDDLENENAAAIANLATQVLQAKSGYEFGESIGVNEPAVVANPKDNESRSSPQSQHSANLPAEPPELFRGLMGDHDCGTQMLEERVALEYDFEPGARGQVSSGVTGIEESTALPREQHLPGLFHSIMNVATEIEATDQNSCNHEIEMTVAMTASHTENGVLSHSYAGTPTQDAVNPQPLQSQAPQPTTSQPESRSISVERTEHAEQGKESTIESNAQHVDDVPKQEDESVMEADEQHVNDVPGTTITTEEDGGEREGMEEDENKESEEGERGRDETEEGDIEDDEMGEEERGGDERGEAEEDNMEEDEEQESEKDEEQELEKDEEQELEKDEEQELEKDEEQELEKDEEQELEKDEEQELEKDEKDEAEPSPDIGAQQQLTAETDERPTADDEEGLPLTQQQTPRKRGRPRRSDSMAAPPAPVMEQPATAQIAAHEKDTLAGDEAVESAATDDAVPGRAEEIATERKRGRLRKSDNSEPATAAAPTTAKRGLGRPPKVTGLESTIEATHAAGKRGRPRKSSMADVTQMSAVTIELESAIEAPNITPVGKRGRPRKSSMADVTQMSAVTIELESAIEAPNITPVGKRGRPRKSSMIDVTPGTLEAPTTTPVSGKRGRSRKGDMMDATQTSTSSAQLPVVEVTETGPPSGKRGRPRKSDTTNAAQASTEDADLPTVEVAETGPPSGKRGRPRKSDTTNAAQASTEDVDLPAVEVVETGPPSGKRGRPRTRKSDVSDAAQTSSNTAQETATTPARTLSKRGRLRKSDTANAAQASTEDVDLPAVEVAEIGPPSGKRGRPRKSDATNAAQASTEDVDIPAAEVAGNGAASGKRGRPRKNDAVGAAQISAEKFQLRLVEAPVAATPASSKRPRPRKSEMMGVTPAQGKAQLPVVEGPISTTAASSEREPPLEASVTIPTTTAGKRGRPPKSAALLQTKSEILPNAGATQTADSPAVKYTGRRGRPSRQADALEERTVSPTVLSTKKRGRGRPPKSETLSTADLPSATVEPGLSMDSRGKAEPRGPSKPTADISKDFAASETASTPAQEDMTAKTARKRGRPKAAAVDKAPSVVEMLVTAPAKKRGRPPKAIATIDSAEEHAQSDAEEEVEAPAAKRRRTNNSTTMKDAVGGGETRGDAQENEWPGVEELRNAVAATRTKRKRSSVTWATPLSSTSTAPNTVAEPTPRLGKRPRLSGERLEESTRSKRVEQPLAAPKTLFDKMSDGRRVVRQKTYGKRSKR